MKNIYIYLSFVSLAMGTVASCTDLTDKVYSEITEDAFITNPNALNTLIGKAYASMGNCMAESSFIPNEQTADEMIIPFRNISNEWGGSKYREQYSHSWTPKTADFPKRWNTLFGLVTTTNQVLEQIETMSSSDTNTKNRLRSELRMIRAFAYYYIIDLWGDVPLIVSTNTSSKDVIKRSSSDIYKFIMTEFNECLPHLSIEVSKKYGKMHRYAALALKAKYLINANVFLDTSRNNADYPFENAGLDECIEVCNEIIKDGGYNLENDYFTNFKANNTSSKENILVIPFHPTYTQGTGNVKDTGFNLARMCLHANQKVVYNSNGALWNGFSALPSMYKSFNENDERRKGWNVGAQTHNGEILRCAKAASHNAALDFTIDWDINNCHEYDGARLVKFEFVQGMDAVNMDNDFPVIRYADILLMKAEAIMRKNNWVATQETVDLVNKVRNRSFKDAELKDYYTTENLTKKELLQERRREFYAEMIRRTDLIRFHAFIGGDWENLGRPEESYTQYYRTIFPIPQEYLYVAPNVKQHEGY